MESENLSQRVKALGFPLLETGQALDVAATLADVVKSRDVRLWEGFPVMLATALEKGFSDLDEVRRLLESADDKEALSRLVAVACGLYAFVGTDVPGLKKVEEWGHYSAEDFQKALQALKRNTALKLGGRELDAQRFKKAFQRYFSEWESVTDFVAKKELLDLEYALNQVFPPKQKQLFLKRLKGGKMTKTEREYYSRVVRKKVLALANPELHRLAQQLATTD